MGRGRRSEEATRKRRDKNILYHKRERERARLFRVKGMRGRVCRWTLLSTKYWGAQIRSRKKTLEFQKGGSPALERRLGTTGCFKWSDVEVLVVSVLVAGTPTCATTNIRWEGPSSWTSYSPLHWDAASDPPRKETTGLSRVCSPSRKHGSPSGTQGTYHLFFVCFPLFVLSSPLCYLAASRFFDPELGEQGKQAFVEFIERYAGGTPTANVPVYWFRIM